MTTIAILLFSLVLRQGGDVVGTVETTFDKATNFSALRTYTWIAGYNAERSAAHKEIVAACDAEMAKSGFTKVATNADVTLAYYAVRSTYVDVKALDKLRREGSEDAAPTNAVGRLVVIMRAGSPAKQLWSASTREILDPDPARLSETIRIATARLFDSYPGRTPPRP